MINFDNLIGRFEQYPRASIRGFEFTSGGPLANGTDAHFAYTFMSARALHPVTIENQFIPTLTYRPDELPYRPAHQVDFELRHHFPFGMDAGFNGSYVSEMTFYNHADPENNLAMAGTREKLAGYFLADIRLNQKLPGGFSMYFALENLTNRQYQTLYLYPAPGRTFRGGIRLAL
jgi:outer membrane receptor protein involved in Fe transport